MRSLSGFAARLAGWALLAAVTAIPALAEERSVVGLGYAPHIVWDGIAGKLRLWQHDGFEAELKFEQRDSTDGGNTWSAPTVIRNGPQRYGTSVIDEGVPGPQRFKNAFYQSRSGADGIYTEISPDGVNWSVTTQAPIFTPAEADDIADLWMNPLTGGYGLFLKRWVNGVRQTWISHAGPSFSGWSRPVPAFVPDAADQGITQFYGAAGPVMRDGLLVFFVRVLRDDIARGVGYTVLAWSRDGKTFTRAREPFLAGRRGKPDEAMTWVYAAAEHTGTLYLSYAGYDTGHKIGARTAMLAKMPSADFQSTPRRPRVRRFGRADDQPTPSNHGARDDKEQRDQVGFRFIQDAAAFAHDLDI